MPPGVARKAVMGLAVSTDVTGACAPFFVVAAAMEMIVEPIVWLVAMLAFIVPIVLLGGFFMWFAARRVTGDPYSYRRCCVVNAISAAIQTVFGLFLWLVLPNPSETEITVAMGIQFSVSWCIHMGVMCKWLSVTAGQAFLITVYHVALGIGLLAVMAALWFMALIVTGN